MHALDEPVMTYSPCSERQHRSDGGTAKGRAASGRASAFRLPSQAGRVAVGCLLALLCSCIDLPMTAMNQSDEDIRACIEDVWQSGSTLECDGCDGADAPLECADDCVLRSFRWFHSGDVLVQGFFQSSASREVFGTRAAPLMGEYSVEGGRLIEAGSNRDEPLTVTCSEDEIVIGSSVTHRAPEGAAESFRDAFAEDGWSGEPYLQ